MRVYISGPITGVENFRDRFDHAETMLINKGHYPVNPCKLDAVMPPDSEWEDFLVVELAILERCDAIFMLYGWEKSKGARREIVQAAMRGLKIFLTPFDVPKNEEGEEDAKQDESQG